MSTTLVVILAVLIGLTLLVLVLGLTGSRTLAISRSIEIGAPPERVYPLIENFREWTKWSPFEGVEGDELQRNYTGAPKGKGAVYSWKGRKTGQGRMEIVEAADPRLVGIDLQFIKPFKASNTAAFILTPSPAGTTATWSMAGPMPFINRVMSKFVSFDRVLGDAFEKGLASMKRAAEAA